MANSQVSSIYDTGVENRHGKSPSNYTVLHVSIDKALVFRTIAVREGLL